jgi:hypothetical protein
MKEQRSLNNGSTVVANAEKKQKNNEESIGLRYIFSRMILIDPR